MSATYCSVSQFKERHSKGRATYSLSLPSFRPLPFFFGTPGVFHISSHCEHRTSQSFGRNCPKALPPQWLRLKHEPRRTDDITDEHDRVPCYILLFGSNCGCFFTKGTLLLILTVVPFAITSSRSSNSGFSNMFKTFEVCLSFGTMVLNRFHFKFTPNYSEFLCWRNFWSWSG